ncbi:MAG TPA: DUF3536 domain-containing protein [Thermoanaerobaculia bacterium]|nr:DUF3536 domain-containing protein [Thermoanaerobaculia bacterium]
MEELICIHCHFYQPARENPWLETVELQDSAHPYHDWNERITAESYAPNGAARILDDRGRIGKIVNNYARISFNFGATLLAWMEEHSPDTWAAIREGDAESQKVYGGHGSAIAQAHSHVILPLANDRDRRTQVIWGLRDFELRFGRPSEGIWLPETAVDIATLEALAEAGIAFTILAPNQANAVREIGSEEWLDVSGSRIDPTMPYRAFLPSGRTIDLFFYDGPISRAVAFEGLLSNGESFLDRLMSGFSDERGRSQLMHIATDGETYGHHHPHGEMALAWLLDRLERDPEVGITNYGQFLEDHPPTHEVQIVEYSSWSCMHGVERWRSDCGCRTGGSAEWSQAWRGPLRDALDWLRDEISPKFEELASPYLRDPWAARDGYIDVIANRAPENVDRFLSNHSKGELSGDETVTVLKLLELQRFAMLMYTSCGWFFNELSGIETVQVIQYAARVIQLAEELFGGGLEEELLGRLEKAKSNVPDHQSGRIIYEKFARTARVDLARVAAHYAVSSLFEDYGELLDIYCYEVEREDYQKHEAGRAKLAVGRVRVVSRITREARRFSFGVLYLGDLNVTGGVRDYRGDEAYQTLVEEMMGPIYDGDFPAIIRRLDRHFGKLTFSMKSLFRDEQRKILRLIWDATLSEAESAYRNLYDRYRPLMRFHEDLFVPLPSVLRITAEAAINLNLAHALERDDLPVSQIESLLREAKLAAVPLDEASLAYSFQRTVERIAGQLEASPESPLLLQRLDAAVTLANELPFNVNLWKVQNTYYRLLLAVRESATVPDNGNGSAQRRELYRSIAQKLSVEFPDESA